MRNYEKWFWIEKNIWNNSFHYEEREKKWEKLKIYVAKLIEWTIKDIKIWENPSIRGKNENNKIIFYNWLKNFVKIKWKQIYIFDNHNHALYFWYIMQEKYLLKKWANLIHIDQHSDLKDWKHIENINIENIFYLTNYILNVWNYIIPAQKMWIISNNIQVRTNYKLKEIVSKNFDKESTILNIDLDFWHPDMINDDEKINNVKKIIDKIKYITISTSPYFIDQKIAINILKKLLQ